MEDWQKSNEYHIKKSTTDVDKSITQGNFTEMMSRINPHRLSGQFDKVHMHW